MVNPPYGCKHWKQTQNGFYDTGAAITVISEQLFMKMKPQPDLAHENDPGKMQAIAYASKSLKPFEKNYTPYLS